MSQAPFQLQVPRLEPGQVFLVTLKASGQFYGVKRPPGGQLIECSCELVGKTMQEATECS